MSSEMGPEYKFNLLLKTSDPEWVDKIVHFVNTLVWTIDAVHVELNGRLFVEFSRRDATTPPPEIPQKPT